LILDPLALKVKRGKEANKSFPVLTFS
jgi:hypothetical protein